MKSGGEEQKIVKINTPDSFWQQQREAKAKHELKLAEDYHRLQRLSGKGDVTADYLLAVAFLGNGYPGEQNDKERYLRLLMDAAEKHHAGAAWTLGRLYFHGAVSSRWKVAFDQKRALYYLELGIEGEGIEHYDVADGNANYGGNGYNQQRCVALCEALHATISNSWQQQRLRKMKIADANPPPRSALCPTP